MLSFTLEKENSTFGEYIVPVSELYLYAQLMKAVSLLTHHCEVVMKVLCVQPVCVKA